jgi:hypothetical protein
MHTECIMQHSAYWLTVKPCGTFLAVVHAIVMGANRAAGGNDLVE